MKRALGRAPLCVIALLAPALAGCATSPTSVDSAALERRRGQRLLLVLQPTDDFMAPFTGPLSSSGSLMDLADMAIRGKAIVSDNQVPDPATELGTNLAKKLAERYALQLAVVREKRPENALQRGRTVAPKPVRPQADLVLEVLTTRWGMRRSPSGPGRSKVYYAASVKLSDGRGSVLVAGDCPRNPGGAEAVGALEGSNEDTLAANATVLKGELQRQAEFCEVDLSSRLFYLSTARPSAARPSPATAADDGAAASTPAATPSDQERDTEQPR